VSNNWTPAELTTAIWLKEQGTIDSWTDHSGNARHFTQATTAAQPSISNTLNGLTVRTFGGNDFLRYNASISYTAATIFVVARYSGSETFQRIYSHTTSGVDAANTGSNYIPILRNAGTNALCSYASDNMRSSLAVATNTYCIFGNVHSGSSFTNYANGTAGSSFSHTLNGTFVDHRLGWLANTGANSEIEYLTGDIAEVVVCPSALDATNRQKLEGYLAHKWGLTSVLDAGHPYKTTAPTI
jgi:hypothetical protein